MEFKAALFCIFPEKGNQNLTRLRNTLIRRQDTLGLPVKTSARRLASLLNALPDYKLKEASMLGPVLIALMRGGVANFLNESAAPTHKCDAALCSLGSRR